MKCDVCEKKDYFCSDECCGCDFDEEFDGGFDGFKLCVVIGEEDIVFLLVFG